MRRMLVIFLAVAFGLPGQKIATETPARDRIVRVQTALNHLTVIEVAEPVTTVAVGSPQAFKVERRENKVFIQPLQDGTTTNLFIWTATTRLNYELLPATNDAGQMDFAIDYRQPPRQSELQPPSSKPAAESGVPPDMLLHGTPVRLVGFKHSKAPRVDVTIRDIYRTEERIFIRYTIENHTGTPYQPSTPRVVSLKSPRCDRSLTSLTNSQLGDEYLSRLRSDGTETASVMHAQSPEGIRPGDTNIGVVAIQLLPMLDDAKRNGMPIVLRIVFPADGERQVTATLVL